MLLQQGGNTTCYLAEVAEAFSIKEGVVLACELKLSNVILESNSTVVLQALVSRSGFGEMGLLFKDLLPC